MADRTLEILLKVRSAGKREFDALNRTVGTVGKVGVSAFRGITRGIVTTQGKLATLIGGFAAFDRLVRRPADFAEEFAKFGTLGEEARDRLAEFRTEIEEIGLATGKNLEELSTGLFDIASGRGSRSLDQVKEDLDDVVTLAVAGFSDTAAAGRGVNAVLNSYGEEIEDAGRAAEVFFATQQAGTTTIEALTSNVGKVTQFAAEAGVSFEELGAGIATVTNTGLSTEETITSIRAALVAINKPSEDFKELLDDIGLGTGKAAFEGRTLGQVFTLIKNEAQKQNLELSAVLGNIRAISAISSIGADNGRDFAATLEQMSEGGEELAAAFELMNSQTNSFFGTVQNFQTIAGTAFSAEIVRPLIEGLDESERKGEILRLKAEELGITLAQAARGAAFPFQALFDFLSSAADVFITNWETTFDSYVAQVELVGVTASAVFRVMFLELRRAGVIALDFVTERFEDFLTFIKQVARDIALVFQIAWKTVLDGVLALVETGTEKLTNFINSARRLVRLDPIELVFEADLERLKEDLGREIKSLEDELLTDVQRVDLLDFSGQADELRQEIRDLVRDTDDEIARLFERLHAQRLL